MTPTTTMGGASVLPTDRPLTAGDDWIEWHGGENPVPGTWVEVSHRGRIMGFKIGWGTADNMRWTHNGSNEDIIAYRLARPATSAASEGEGKLKADFTRSHPSGMDDSTYEQIEDALDRADAPIIGEDGRFLTLAQRVASLASPPSERERGLEGALADLVSWFTKPVQGIDGTVWVIRAGDLGADDAIKAARSRRPTRRRADPWLMQ